MNNDDLHKAQEKTEASSKDDYAKELELVRAAKTRLKRGRRSMDTIDNVLSKLVSSMGLDKRLKEHALLSLYPMVIGDRFAARSRPLFIDFEGNIVIAASDSSVAQELSLLKPEIIKKMRIAANSMGLKVNGVRFDLKHFHGGTPAVGEDNRFEAHKQTTRSEPLPEELAQLTLSESDLQELAALKASLPPPDPNDIDILKSFKLYEGESMVIKPRSPSSPNPNGKSKEVDVNHRIVAMFEQELKLRQWRRTQGFPVCPKCRQPTQLLHGAESICADCYYAEWSRAHDI